MTPQSSFQSLSARSPIARVKLNIISQYTEMHSQAFTGMYSSGFIAAILSPILRRKRKQECIGWHTRIEDPPTCPVSAALPLTNQSAVQPARSRDRILRNGYHKDVNINRSNF